MSKNFFAFVRGIVFIQLFLIAIFIGLTIDFQGFAWEYFRGTEVRSLLAAIGPKLNEPLATALFREQNVMMTDKAASPQQNFLSYFYTVSPEQILGANIQALAYSEPEAPTAETPPVLPTVELPAVVQEDKNNTAETPNVNREALEKLKNYRAYFYCTHSSESYIPNSGQAKLEGKQGLINTVAKSLTESCREQGLEGVFENKIHDFPDYDKSYTLSRETVKKIVKQDPKALGLFDVHRDSVPGTTDAPRIKIKGKSSAQILIIVGTNERKPHPHWKQNLEFANKLLKQGEKQYPGLIRGVRTKAGTYNQEYNTHALLLEFGTDYNTLEEAKYAAELFAEVVVEVLKEEI